MSLFGIVKMHIRHAWQRLTRGFSDRDLWDLDYTIASFILPRLQRFKEVNIACPDGLTKEEWDATLDKMIATFKHLTEEDSLTMMPSEEIREGLSLFAKYFTNLWD